MGAYPKTSGHAGAAVTPAEPLPYEILTDSLHRQRNPHAWVSLTTGPTGVGAPGRNGTPQPQNYVWKTLT
jgi:hypothetical protein